MQARIGRSDVLPLHPNVSRRSSDGTVKAGLQHQDNQPPRMLSRMFAFAERGTTLTREARGGFATFLTMAYILAANPAILSAAGVPAQPAMAATAIAAALCTLLMGVVANFPLALAPGMGLNAVVAFQVAPLAGSWQAAMGLVVLDGVIVLALVLLGLREAVMNAIPADLRRAISVGIGLFIAFIGAVNARLVVVPEGTVHTLSKIPTAILPPVTHGPLSTPEPFIAIAGVLIMGFLLHRRIPGAIVLGMLGATAIALALGAATLPEGGWLAVPRFETLFQADVAGALRAALVPLLIALVMVDFFDTIGTVTAIADEAGLGGGSRPIPRLRAILGIDALSASIGGLCGASSVTSYIESAAGVAEGARTGFHSVVVAVLFLAAAFVAPLTSVVPQAATAPALIIVGFLMAQQIVRIDFAALDTAIPAFLTMLLIPFTYSISHGIGFGFVTYVVIKILERRFAQVHPVMYVVAAAFAIYFALG
jgi:AGZA family xanthine/uracil permease-like MFS transporter